MTNAQLAYLLSSCSLVHPQVHLLACPLNSQLILTEMTAVISAILIDLKF